MSECPVFNLLSNSKIAQKWHKSNHEKYNYFMKSEVLMYYDSVKIHC